MLDSNNKSDIKIDQKPLKMGGANFTTHKLVEVSPSRCEFKLTLGTILFCAFLIVFPLAMASSFINFSTIHIFFLETVKNNPPVAFPLLLSVIFMIVGWTTFLSFLRPVVFDKNAGFFWKGFRQPSLVYSEKKRKNTVRLEEIYGLQIIKEIVYGKSSYTSYELNLVLKNSERINVVDHGNLRKIKEDAQKLSSFLGVPVLEEVME